MNASTEKPYDLIIVGAGPVGLLSALMAHKSGLRVLVLEKNSGPVMHSKSIGIHPPSLELISEAGLLDAFIAKGKRIRQGHACSQHGSRLGTLYFHSLKSPFNYILTVPQWITESLFVQELNALDPGLLQWDAAVTDISDGNICEVHTSKRNTDTAPDGGAGLNARTFRILTAKMVMGCDGKNSTIRQLSGIPFHGGSYSSRYAMGDFKDNTGYGSDAVIFLSRDGLVECFPLPGGIRRWVLQQEADHPVGDALAFTEQIRQRCGIAPEAADCSMFSQFSVERYLAETFWRGRVVLAGDSAHVVSPIGGQGMNLGWINAAQAVRHIAAVLKEEQSLSDAARIYTRQARGRAKKVISRAEFNMMLANRKPLHRLRNQLVRLLLASPLRHPLRRRFTMQDL